MNREEAIQFLESHQPMPADVQWTDELAERYAAVMKFFSEHPEPAAATLFLGSFGDGDGLGTYQLVVDVLHKLPSDAVIQALARSLRSARQSVRYWSAEVSAEFPSVNLVEPLGAMLESEAATDNRAAAAIALAQIDDAQVDQLLGKFAQSSDHHVAELCGQLIQDRSNKPMGPFQ
jgi:HEAT repeat protein